MLKFVWSRRTYRLKICVGLKTAETGFTLPKPRLGAFPGAFMARLRHLTIIQDVRFIKTAEILWNQIVVSFPRSVFI